MKTLRVDDVYYPRSERFIREVEFKGRSNHDESVIRGYKYDAGQPVGYRRELVNTYVSPADVRKLRKWAEGREAELVAAGFLEEDSTND